MPGDAPAEAFNQIMQELTELRYVPGTETHTPHPIKQTLADMAGKELDETWSCFLYESSTGECYVKNSVQEATAVLEEETEQIENTKIDIKQKDGRTGIEITTVVPDNREERLDKARNLGDAISAVVL
jgi:hypothetical protein